MGKHLQLRLFLDYDGKEEAVMRFHVVALPHTQVNDKFSACAFNEKVRKFCIMMKMLGHTVYLYAGDDSQVKVDEKIVCITEEERVASLAGKHYTEASFDNSLPHWQKFNQNVIDGIKERAEQKDFICIIGGLAHKPIADAFPTMITVEFGIGYPGSFAKYRVFESYAWMHTTYGAQAGQPNTDGNWFDAVIPSYFELEKFPFEPEKDDYYLFIGRMIDRKGYKIAQEVCEHMGVRLILAGPGEAEGYGDHIGTVDAKIRGELMGKAKAVFVPTIYVEPFGSVAVEAQLCGTPVITTDWGAFTETVVDGVTGFRCHTFQEFVDAAIMAPSLDPALIRRLNEKYSLESVAMLYQKYFNRLLTLWDDGWYNIA